MGLIFWMSAQTGQASGALSTGLLKSLFSQVSHLLGLDLGIAMTTEQIDLWHHLLRKAAHFIAYWVLGMLVYWDVRSRAFGNHFGWAGLYTIAVCASYAITDEVHQAFVPGRGPSAFDVVIDTGGSILGFLSAYLLYKLFLRRTYVALVRS